LARIYDVVCPRCGEVMEWCKYDPPIEKCTFCGYRMARREENCIGRMMSSFSA